MSRRDATKTMNQEISRCGRPIVDVEEERERGVTSWMTAASWPLYIRSY